MAARTNELDQIIAMFPALCIQLRGIIHASSYSKECIFPRL